jgi:segregation and condensation protein B
VPLKKQKAFLQLYPVLRSFTAKKLDYLAQHIEALIFATDSPVSLKTIRDVLEETFGMKFPKSELKELIEQLKAKYQADDFAMEIVEMADGFHFMSKAAYHETIAIHLKQTTKKRLSRSALETLSIIAYKQPVTKSDMEKIRGVSCDYAVQKLLEKELVAIVGRSDSPGRPLLYGTSEKFMDYFGLKNIEDLPKLKDFKTPDNEIGEQAPIEEGEASSDISANENDNNHE